MRPLHRVFSFYEEFIVADKPLDRNARREVSQEIERAHKLMLKLLPVKSPLKNQGIGGAWRVGYAYGESSGRIAHPAFAKIRKA